MNNGGSINRRSLYFYIRFLSTCIVMFLIIFLCNLKSPNDFWREFISLTYLGFVLLAPANFIIFEFYFSDWIFGNIKEIDLDTLRIYHRELIRLLGVIISVFILSLSLLWSQRDVLGALRIQSTVLIIFFGYSLVIFSFTVIYRLKNEIVKKSKEYQNQNKIKLEFLKKHLNFFELENLHITNRESKNKSKQETKRKK